MKLGRVVIWGEGRSCDWTGARRPLGGWPYSFLNQVVIIIIIIYLALQLCYVASVSMFYFIIKRVFKSNISLKIK